MSGACATLILAAGQSRRMGVAKAKLLLDGVPLWRHIWNTARAAGAAPVIVVVGQPEPHDPCLLSRTEVERALSDAPQEQTPTRVCVGAPDADPMASIRVGLSHVPTGCALLLWPVDQPFADRALVRRLMDAVLADRGAVAQPRADGRSGHPVAFGAEVVRELRCSAPGATARTVVRANPRRRVAVTALDVRLGLSINTPTEARAAGVVLP